MRAFFGWCLGQGLIDRNPALGVERRKEHARTRVLAPAEIRALWQGTEDASEYSIIVRLLLLTGCRANEIAALKWSEIFPDRIVLPGERVKNGRTHMLPITSTVRTILNGLPRRGDDYVFGRVIGRPFAGWTAGKHALEARLEAAGIALPKWVRHDCGEPVRQDSPSLASSRPPSRRS